MQAMRFSKYHGLGNDYLVIDEMALMQSPERIRLICDRNFGIGSDGILFGPLPSKLALAGLRIFNPDGSEAEKSGNGIRIFFRHLWERGSIGSVAFVIVWLPGVALRPLPPLPGASVSAAPTCECKCPAANSRSRSETSSPSSSQDPSLK